MKLKLKPLAISLCLLGWVSTSAFAVTDQNTAGSSNNATLEAQVAELQKEVNELKEARQAHVHTHKTVAKHHVATKHAHNENGSAPVSSDLKTNQAPGGIKKLISTAERSEAEADKNLPNVSGPQYLPESGIQYLPVDLDVPGQSFVSTGPYIGVPYQYSGGDLVINSPSVNEDVLLLNLRKNINKRLAALGLKPTDLHSHLLLSGIVEGQANWKDAGGSANSSDIDLTSAGLDAYILTPSTWVSGLISLNYDNNIGAQEGSLNTNYRAANSRVFVNKAFIVVGDFAQSPFYGTLGQMYVPFGTYSNTLISSPLTKLLARTQERAVLVGFQQQQQDAFYGAVYGFKGDSYVGSTSRLNNGGINVGYKFSCFDNYSGNFGGGVIANLADSQGMQDTGNQALTSTFGAPATFGGFGGTDGTGNEKITHRVPAYNIRGLFSIGKTIDLLAEYITASTAFNPNDLSFKSHGAKPQALDAEATYTFQSLAKPTSFTLAYGMTKEALALGLPAQRYSAALNTSFWRNTLQTLEFRHDINYALSAASSGSGIPGPVTTGSHDNMVTAQFDIYF